MSWGVATGDRTGAEGRCSLAKEKSLRFTIFRHGITNYGQGRVATALDGNDLTEDGRRNIPLAVDRALPYFEGGASMVARSSPYGRAAETAVRTIGLLRERGVGLRALCTRQPGGVFIEDELEEVRGFDRERFMCFVHGGRMQDEGMRPVIFDQADTNPRGLSPEAYFFADAAFDIPEAVTREWPRALRDAHEQTETCRDVTRRMLRFLFGLLSEYDSAHHVCFTHDGLVVFIVSVATGGDKISLDRGSFIHLVPSGGDLVVQKVDGWEGTLSHVGIFAAARKKYGASFI